MTDRKNWRDAADRRRGLTYSRGPWTAQHAAFGVGQRAGRQPASKRVDCVAPQSLVEQNRDAPILCGTDPMPRRYTFAMEIRHFRYFLAIAEAGSFAEGAKRLCIAQPSLTRQIRALEDQLGCPLFVRSWQGVQLTDSGEILLREARLAVAQFDLALKRTREGKQHPRKLALGMIPGTEDELMGASRPPSVPSCRTSRSTFTASCISI